MRTSRRSHNAILVACAAIVLLTPLVGGAATERTWHLTNNFEEHQEGNNTVFGPGLSMVEGGGNGTFPTGHLLAMDAGAFRSRVWSASPVATGSFSTRSWTISFGGESVVTDLRFTVGSWDYRTGTFTAARGDAGEVGPTRTGTFTPTSPVSVPAGRELALRVWVPDDAPPSLLDVWDATGGSSPSTLTLG